MGSGGSETGKWRGKRSRGLVCSGTYQVLHNFFSFIAQDELSRNSDPPPVEAFNAIFLLAVDCVRGNVNAVPVRAADDP